MEEEEEDEEEGVCDINLQLLKNGIQNWCGPY
jgi:hypothetical protein